MFSLLDDIVPRCAEKNGTKPGGDIVTMLLKKRFLSSPFIRDDPEPLRVLEGGPWPWALFEGVV